MGSILFSRSFYIPLLVYVLPAYRSYNLLLKNDKGSINSMLHYWVAIVLLKFCLFVIQPLVISTGKGDTLLILAALMWFIHPYFSGYEVFYNFWISRLILPYQEQIHVFFHSAHLIYWKFLTLTVQYIMLFFDRSVLQMKQIIANKPPSKHIK